jgi:hypothetical protein
MIRHRMKRPATPLRFRALRRIPVSRWLLVGGALIALGGCTSIRRNEAQYEGALLKAAGFDVEPTDSVAREEALNAIPPLEIVSRENAGSLEYRLADPYLCRCLYVGDPHSYRQYQRLLSDDFLRAVLGTPSL